jgi:dipeptidase
MNYLVLLTLILLVFSKDNPKYDYLYRSKLNNENIKLEQQEMHWFSQIVDHYDYQKEQYFKQRYWVINDYFNPKNGPVFLYICGEWECTGVPEERLWVVVLAQKLQGLILVL